MQATVVCVNDSTLCAHGPTFKSIQKLYVQKISGNSGVLLLPRAAAIHRAVDAAAAADGPTQAIINK
jgi:hypothetical protein